MPTYTTIGGQPGVYVPSGTPEMLLEIKEPAEHKATSSEKSPCSSALSCFGALWLARHVTLSLGPLGWQAYCPPFA